MSSTVETQRSIQERRRRGARRVTTPAKGHFVDRLIAVTIAVTLFGWWELAARMDWIEAFIFPPPSRIIARLAVLLQRDLLENIWLTLVRFSGGVLVGGIPGIIFGLCVGWLPRLRRIVDPFIAAVHSIPKIVLFPLLIVIFGMNEWAKIISISLTVFFPTVINSAAGAREIAPLYSEVIRSYGGNRAAMFRYVILPGSVPMILSGVRIAATLGLLVTIAIEFTVTTKGIGSVIWLAWQTLRTEELYVGVIIISTLGMAMNFTIQTLLRRLAPWHVRD